MSTALAQQTGLPGRFLDDAYMLPEGLPFERWHEVVETLQQIDYSVKWWIGDALLYGEAAYGQMASQAFPDAFSGRPYAASTLRAAMWVSERFPRGTRVEGLTWTHHRVVAEMAPVEARALLAEALGDSDRDKPRLSTRELIELRDSRNRQLAGGAQTIDGEVLDSAALPPTKEDLTDEARAPLEVRLSEMSSRMRPGFESGWVAALVWAGQDDAFKEGRG